MNQAAEAAVLIGAIWSWHECSDLNLDLRNFSKTNGKTNMQTEVSSAEKTAFFSAFFSNLWDSKKETKKARKCLFETLWWKISSTNIVVSCLQIYDIIRWLFWGVLTIGDDIAFQEEKYPTTWRALRWNISCTFVLFRKRFQPGTQQYELSNEAIFWPTKKSSNETIYQSQLSSV